MNDHLVLVGGKSGAGKSASLRTLENPEGVWFLNCEAGKRLPFKSKFQQFIITDPHQITEAITAAEDKAEVHTIVIDSLTYLLEMYNSIYIHNNANGMKAWGNFAEYFKDLMQQHVASSSKQIIFTAHIADVFNESESLVETMIPVKGSTKNNGIESYFSCVITARKLTLKQLDGYKSDLLNITPEEEALGYKHVYQTKITKDTVNHRIRSPLGMWDTKETFIDNDVQLVLQRLNEYYED